MGSRSNVRIPCPAMGSSPPGGPPKKTPGNKIFACLCPCSVFEYIDSEGLKKKPGGGLGKVGGLRKGMIHPDDALLKKPLRIVMEEVDCSKLDFSQCPKCPPLPKDCSPPKSNNHITAAPCVTQTKQNPPGVLKTNKICPVCPPQKVLIDRPKANCPSRPDNCPPCPEPGRDRKSPDKNHTGLEGVTNSVLEMTLDQTGNLINQCAPKGSPTILKVEKLDEAGAAETVIKITFCSGRSQQTSNGTAAIPAQKKCSSHSQQVPTPVNQQVAKPVGQPAATPRGQPAAAPVRNSPASTHNSPVRGKSPPKSQQPQKASEASEGSYESHESHESDVRSQVANRNESIRTEDEEEEEEDEEYEDEERSPNRRVVNIALVQPSEPKPQAPEYIRENNQKNETLPSQPLSREGSALVYQTQPPEELVTTLPLPRPIWLPPSMFRSPSPPCHDKDMPHLTYSSSPNKNEVTFESLPKKRNEEQAVKEEAHEKRVANEIDGQKTDVRFLKPTRKRSWRSTSLRKTIHGTKDISMAITFAPTNDPSNDDPADSLRPLMSMRSAEALIKQLESLPIPSKTWGLRAEEFEAIATTSTTDITKVNASPRPSKPDTQHAKKVKSPTRAVVRRSPPRESNMLVKKTSITPKVKPKGPMQLFFGKSADASSITGTALRKRNMRVICASSIKREIRPSSGKKLYKETAV